MESLYIGEELLLLLPASHLSVTNKEESDFVAKPFLNVHRSRVGIP